MRRILMTVARCSIQTAATFGVGRPLQIGRGKSRDVARELSYIRVECLNVVKLSKGPLWTYEIKLDGFRLEAVKQSGEKLLYSRRGNLLDGKFPYIADALKKLPDSSIIDGEVVALDAQRRSDFRLLQNFTHPAPTGSTH